MSYDLLAGDIMFAGQCDPGKHGLVYRKGKTLEDVRGALRKARDPKNGRAKTEVELSMLEVYLRGIFKKAR